MSRNRLREAGLNPRVQHPIPVPLRRMAERVGGTHGVQGHGELADAPSRAPQTACRGGERSVSWALSPLSRSVPGACDVAQQGSSTVGNVVFGTWGRALTGQKENRRRGREARGLHAASTEGGKSGRKRRGKGKRVQASKWSVVGGHGFGKSPGGWGYCDGGSLCRDP